MTLRCGPSFVVVAACTLCVSPAPARAGDPATEAFDRGLADMKAGRYDTGCPAIAESYRLDPKAGALFTLAECEAEWGKHATAFGHYARYLSLLDAMPADARKRQAEREKVARAQVAALSPRIARVTLVLAPSVPPGTTVRRGGALVAAAELGTEIVVDAGPLSLVVEAPGRPPLDASITLAPGESRRVELAASPAPATEPTTRTPAPAVHVEPARRTWVYVAGGVGLAGVAVGALTGALTIGKKSTIDDHCKGLVCDAEGVDAADASKSLGLVSTVGFGVGLVGLGAAIVLFATEPRSPAATGRGSSGGSPAPAPSMLTVGATPTGATASLRRSW